MEKVNEKKYHKYVGKKVTFKRNFDFALNMIGLMVGFSNVWRFPYMCYKNGGGAFIVAYLVFATVLVLPLVVIESALGQYTGKSAMKVWKIVPLFSGLGFVAPIIMFFCDIYLPVLLSWNVRWLGATFNSDVPWANCKNEWNTNSCIPLLGKSSGLKNGTAMNSSSDFNSSRQYTSSVEEFWTNNILAVNSGIENIGPIKPDLLLCLTIVWVVSYFSIWKGIAWTSKVVYVTATSPIVMLLIVLVRSATLEGASDGIEAYIKPDITKLGKIELWKDAASQVLFSLGVCAGGISTLSQFNKFKHNFFSQILRRDSIILVAANAAVSFMAGFACFSVLGFLANTKNTTIDEVATKGPGLVFVAYPTALSLLPMPQLWCSLFFIMMLLIGLDSFFVYHETFMSCIKDLCPRIFCFRYASEVWTAVAALILYILALPMVTPGGIYVLEIFNNYSTTGWCLYLLSLLEFIAIGWVCGVDKFCDIMKEMLGFDVPRMMLKITWKFVGPLSSMVLMIYSFIDYVPLKYNSYVYPVWADLLGWATALASMLTFPVGAVCVLYKAKGSTLTEKLGTSVVVKDVRRELSPEENYELEMKTVEESERAML